MQVQWSRSRLLLGLPLLTALSLMSFSIGAGQEGPITGVGNVSEGDGSLSPQPKRGFGDGLKLLIPNESAGVFLGGVGQTGDSLGTIRREVPSATVGLPSQPGPVVLAAPPANLYQPLIIINRDESGALQYPPNHPGAPNLGTMPVIINTPNQDTAFPHFGGNGFGGQAGHANHGGHGGGLQAGHSSGHAGTGAAHHGSGGHSGSKH